MIPLVETVYGLTLSRRVKDTELMQKLLGGYCSNSHKLCIIAGMKAQEAVLKNSKNHPTAGAPPYLDFNHLLRRCISDGYRVTAKTNGRISLKLEQKCILAWNGCTNSVFDKPKIITNLAGKSTETVFNLMVLVRKYVPVPETVCFNVFDNSLCLIELF